MTNALDHLIRIVPDHPAQRLMHFVDRGTPLTDKLAALAVSHEYEYQILTLDETVTASLSQRYAAEDAVKIRPITLERSRYNLQAKLYEFVFVEATVTDQTHFAKTVHSAMKNGANLFILCPAQAAEEVETWRKILEESFFVAFSTFDLDETQQVISAKKMHGWGG